MMKAAGITIVTMGIGGEISLHKRLIKWATNPSYFLKTGFVNLKSSNDIVNGIMCQGRC